MLGLPSSFLISTSGCPWPPEEDTGSPLSTLSLIPQGLTEGQDAPSPAPGGCLQTGRRGWLACVPGGGLGISRFGEQGADGWALVGIPAPPNPPGSLGSGQP